MSKENTNKELRDSPEWERYAGAQMEEMKSMFQAIVEYTSDIPAMKEQMNTMQGQINHILTWEDDIKLIPVMFEEMGKLRTDVETLKKEVSILREDTDSLKKAMTLLGRSTEQVEKLEERVNQLELELQKLRAAS